MYLGDLFGMGCIPDSPMTSADPPTIDAFAAVVEAAVIDETVVILRDCCIYINTPLSVLLFIITCYIRIKQ